MLVRLRFHVVGVSLEESVSVPRPEVSWLAMSRFSLVFLAVLTISALNSATSLAQLQTLSRGNADLQWRDAQVKECDKQLADEKLPEELKLELQAQRGWLVKWNPKKLDPAATGQNKAAELRKEPVIDPQELAGKLRDALFNSKTPPTVEDTTALQTALMENSGDVGLRQLQMHWVDQPRYRNEYWKEISEACGRVISLLADEKPSDAVKLATAFAHYRKARAQAHALRGIASKNSGVTGIDKLKEEDIKLLNDGIGESALQIESLVGSGQPEFFQIEIYTLRRDHWSGRALELLEQNANALDQSAHLLEKKALLEALSWKAATGQVAAALKAIPAEQQRQLEIQFIAP